MSWSDRLQALAYTSPKGNRFTPKFEDLENSWEKKTERIDFAAESVTLIREYGYTGRTFPMVLYFQGGDCDKEAAAFETGLKERGFGRLEHPLQGVAYVVPFGAVTRRDDLATAANVTAIQMEFAETTDLALASPVDVPAAAVAESLASAREKITAEAIKGLRLPKSVTAIANIAAEGLKNFDKMVTKLNAAIQGQNFGVRVPLLNKIRALEDNILNLATQPAAFASTILLTTQSILTAPERIRARLAGAYGAVFDLFKETFDIGKQGPDLDVVQETRKIQAAALVLGITEAAVAEPWEKRNDAIAAALLIQTAAAQYIAWKEAQTAKVAEIKPESPVAANADGSDADLIEAATIAAGILVTQSYTLMQERAIITDRARALVDVTAEIYGDPSRIDDVILNNNLTGSEILEIPRGRRLVYYI
jgi:hypothetical protein